MAHDVFISYSSQDKPVADAVCASLEARKIRCWIAPRDVLPGVPYGESIIEGINQSRILVLVFSTHSNDSPQVMREIERAVHKGLTIIPFRIDEVLPTKAMEYFVSAAHWLDAMTPPLERHLHKLGETVQMLLSNEIKEAPREELKAVEAPPPGSRPWWKKARTLYAVASLAVILVIVVVVIKFGFGSPGISPGPAPASAVSSTPAQTPGAPPALSSTTRPALPIPAPINARILYQEDFSDPNSGWQKFSDDTREVKYDNGEYSLTVKKENWSYWCWNRGAGAFKDLIIEGDARLFSGSDLTACGLVFRGQDDISSFYSFSVSGEGNCSFRKRLSGSWTVIKDWSQLTDWSLLAPVNTGKTVNHLKSVMKGNQIDLYVNERLLGSFIDNQFSQGYIGILVINKTAPACGHFDNIKVSSLE